MPNKITRDHIDAAYDIARQVFGGSMLAGEGAARLADERGFNLNSARAFIRCYGHLRKGERYTRTLSNAAADAFLAKIFADDGQDALTQGIASVWAHLEYYEAKTGTTTHGLREVVERHRSQLRQTQVAKSLDAVRQQFERDLAIALARSPQARLERLALAAKKHPKITVTTEVFVRNTDVVAEVLRRANGVCEICLKDAPFKRCNGTPYLEVHHLQQLALGGEDTVENAVAACPNCHRESHFGVPPTAP